MIKKQWQHFSTTELSTKPTKELSWLEFGTTKKKCDCEICLEGGDCKSDRKATP